MVLFTQKMESTSKVTSEQLAQKQKVVEERKQKVNHSSILLKSEFLTTMHMPYSTLFLFLGVG